MPLFVPFAGRLVRISEIHMVQLTPLANRPGFQVQIQVGNLTYGQQFASTEETDAEDVRDDLNLLIDPP